MKTFIKYDTFNSIDETNFGNKILLTDRQVPSLCKNFVNNSLVKRKLPKTHLSKIVQSGGFLGRLLGPLLKIGLRLMEYVLRPLANSVLIPLGLTVVASAAIH